MAINTYLSIITLNVNRQNAPIKRNRVADWIRKKKKSLQYAAYKRPTLGSKDTHRLKVRGWKKIIHANGNDKKVEVTILVSDKVGFKTKSIKKDKEGNCK